MREDFALTTGGVGQAAPENFVKFHEKFKKTS